MDLRLYINVRRRLYTRRKKPGLANSHNFFLKACEKQMNVSVLDRRNAGRIY